MGDIQRNAQVLELARLQAGRWHVQNRGQGQGQVDGKAESLEIDGDMDRQLDLAFQIGRNRRLWKKVVKAIEREPEPVELTFLDGGGGGWVDWETKHLVSYFQR